MRYLDAFRFDVLRQWGRKIKGGRKGPSTTSSQNRLAVQEEVLSRTAAQGRESRSSSRGLALHTDHRKESNNPERSWLSQPVEYPQFKGPTGSWLLYLWHDLLARSIEPGFKLLTRTVEISVPGLLRVLFLYGIWRAIQASDVSAAVLEKTVSIIAQAF